ncbi:NAD(P)/FAD-dependent oxidoreductase [Marinibactrum halimedae]|uniref:FAD-binding domain-containing protein n=1 Tax=Marinibactrum halimedae TaxID=1444977 RepID=A0AA37T2J1_9GAMM|nr:FAD-dependent monooxygenase [Marinibactrum halimedae]MCD9457643.1 FAD-dependent oxidoreductase [Marinibactrum halimedae]GLS24984.1 hypothetical protein GCM10007877_06980 [Marinibactrum halimedae]
MSSVNSSQSSLSSVSAHQECDVLIVGGGVAGCATAIAINQQAPTLRVVVIEKSDDQTPASIGENLSPQVVEPLKALGLWDSFRHNEFLPNCGTAASWGKEALDHYDFSLSPFNQGWNISRQQFAMWLKQEVENRGIEIVQPASVNCVERHSGQWRIEVSTPLSESRYHWQAAFLVDASGRRSVVTSQLGIARTSVDNLVSVYGFVEQDRQSMVNHGLNASGCSGALSSLSALFEATHYGWWYSVPLMNGGYMVAAMTDADIAKELLLSDPDAWKKSLRTMTHTCSRLGDIHWLDGAMVNTEDEKMRLRKVCAQSQYLSQVVGSGWLAVGDSAGCYDPLLSQGIVAPLSLAPLAATVAVHSASHQEDSETIRQYATACEKTWHDYLVMRERLYSEERRFQEYAFWSRRQHHSEEMAVG